MLNIYLNLITIRKHLRVYSLNLLRERGINCLSNLCNPSDYKRRKRRMDSTKYRNSLWLWKSPDMEILSSSLKLNHLIPCVSCLPGNRLIGELLGIIYVTYQQLSYGETKIIVFKIYYPSIFIPNLVFSYYDK